MKTSQRGEVDTKTQPKVWMSAREAAAYVGIHYPTFTRLATKGVVPRTLVEGTKRTYRYNINALDKWMFEHQES